MHLLAFPGRLLACVFNMCRSLDFFDQGKDEQRGELSPLKCLVSNNVKS